VATLPKVAAKTPYTEPLFGSMQATLFASIPLAPPRVVTDCLLILCETLTAEWFRSGVRTIERGFPPACDSIPMLGDCGYGIPVLNVANPFASDRIDVSLVAGRYEPRSKAITLISSDNLPHCYQLVQMVVKCFSESSLIHQFFHLLRESRKASIDLRGLRRCAGPEGIEFLRRLSSCDD
jgi:hypothetical protein